MLDETWAKAPAGNRFIRHTLESVAMTKTEKKSALLLAGWHNICKGDTDLWAHHDCDFLMPLDMAWKVEQTTNNSDITDREEKS